MSVTWLSVVIHYYYATATVIEESGSSALEGDYTSSYVAGANTTAEFSNPLPFVAGRKKHAGTGMFKELECHPAARLHNLFV